MWATGLMTSSPSASRAVKSGVSNSFVPVSGAPSSLCAPEDLLLVADPVDVPGLQQHPDLAHDLVGAAVEPRLVAAVDPHEPGHLVVGLDVAGAVLEPQQHARGLLPRAGRGPAEAQHRPVGDDDAAADPGEVAEGVVADLRVVGARLQAQVATGELRIEQVAVQGGQVGEQRRFEPRQAEPLTEHRRPQPERHGQAGRAQPVRLAGVARGLELRRRLHRADRPAVLEHRDRRRPAGQQHLQVPRAGAGREPERREQRVPLRLRRDPALVPLPVEGVLGAEVDGVVGRRPSRASTPRRHLPPPRRPDRRRRRAGHPGGGRAGRSPPRPPPGLLRVAAVLPASSVTRCHRVAHTTFCAMADSDFVQRLDRRGQLGGVTGLQLGGVVP